MYQNSWKVYNALHKANNTLIQKFLQILLKEYVWLYAKGYVSKTGKSKCF